MSPSSDPNASSAAASAHERARDELASLSLGEPAAADISEHVAECPDCQADLAAYQALTGLARGRAADEPAHGATPPPTGVWDRIVAEIRSEPSMPAIAPGRPDAAPMYDRSRRRTIRAALVAAAVVVLAGAGVGGWAIGRSADVHDTMPAAHATLTAQPGTHAAARGSATMTTTAQGYQLELETTGLPAPSGYYEVWLFDPSIGRMVAVGTLGAGAKGSFTVPAGIDTRAYHVLDVSNQRYDGNAAHQRSVLRGSLTAR